MKFYIWAPNWTMQSSGIRACHSLAHELILRGHNARLVHARSTNLEWEVPIQMDGDPFDPEAVMIYPEIRDDNPLGMRKVVYWRLSEVLHSFTQPSIKLKWAGGFQVDADAVLHVPIIDRRVCNPDDRYPRGMVLSYMAAGGDLLIKDDQTVPWHSLMEMFKRASLFISGDAKTAMLEEARLCGCPVMVTTSPRKFIYEYDDTLGKTYGGAGLKHARDTVKDFAASYDVYVKDGGRLLDAFIERCEQTWQ